VTDDLQATISDVRAATEPPGENDVVFEAPWQARAFALTVALRREGDFPWQAFQTRLVEELESADDYAGASAGTEETEAAYYRAWLAAFERLLLEEDLLDGGELADRVAAFASGERDASEFVVGDRGHAHDHTHEHGHDHSHGHGGANDH
jgi:nitrile hydratase accessory protein